MEEGIKVLEFIKLFILNLGTYEGWGEKGAEELVVEVFEVSIKDIKRYLCEYPRESSYEKGIDIMDKIIREILSSISSSEEFKKHWKESKREKSKVGEMRDIVSKITTLKARLEEKTEKQSASSTKKHNLLSILELRCIHVGSEIGEGGGNRNTFTSDQISKISIEKDNLVPRGLIDIMGNICKNHIPQLLQLLYDHYITQLKLLYLQQTDLESQGRESLRNGWPSYSNLIITLNTLAQSTQITPDPHLLFTQLFHWTSHNINLIFNYITQIDPTQPNFSHEILKQVIAAYFYQISCLWQFINSEHSSTFDFVIIYIYIYIRQK